MDPAYSSLLMRDRVAGVCAGASKYFLMVCQLTRRCCSILRMDQRSSQFRLSNSFILLVVSMARFPLWGRGQPLDHRAVVGKIRSFRFSDLRDSWAVVGKIRS